MVVDYIGPHPLWEGQGFVPTGVDIFILVMNFSFFHVMFPPRLTWTYRMDGLIHCHGIPHRIASDQGTHFSASTGENKGVLWQNFSAF